MKKVKLKAKLTKEVIQDLNSITEEEIIELQKKFNAIAKLELQNIKTETQDKKNKKINS